jgi:hypothetical protein
MGVYSKVHKLRSFISSWTPILACSASPNTREFLRGLGMVEDPLYRLSSFFQDSCWQHHIEVLMPSLPHIGTRYQALEKEISIFFIALPQYL